MSWWISLEDENDRKAVVDEFSDGGTYALGGTNEASLNVTYNYGKLFSFSELGGKAAVDTETTLMLAVSALGTKRDIDYWKPTPGNVGYALSILLKWAKQYPKYYWRVS